MQEFRCKGFRQVRPDPTPGLYPFVGMEATKTREAEDVDMDVDVRGCGSGWMWMVVVAVDVDGSPYTVLSFVSELGDPKVRNSSDAKAC